jgi:hypothetical protein
VIEGKKKREAKGRTRSSGCVTVCTAPYYPIPVHMASIPLNPDDERVIITESVEEKERREQALDDGCW